MHDDTLINPDDIGSQEELHALLHAIGFPKTTEAPAAHPLPERERETRFSTMCSFPGAPGSAYVRVMTGNRLGFDYWTHLTQEAAMWPPAGEITGPCSYQAISERIRFTIAIDPDHPYKYGIPDELSQEQIRAVLAQLDRRPI